MSKKSWFVVDKKGLAQLQEGKPKVFILRELIANAFDEDITECQVILEMGFRKINAKVIDDSPEGFKDLADSFTLFKETSKRIDPTKRGRFNLGEKQAFCRCTYAKIETTKGSVFFDQNGRHSGRTRRKKGSQIEITFKGTREDFVEILSIIKTYLPPKNIRFIVNGELIPYRKPFKITSASLTTEKTEGEIFRRTTRKTDIHIHKTEGETWIFEMGIPVVKIDCEYSVDVQQKVPLGIDRETVSEAFLRDVYAEVMSVMVSEIDEGNISRSWIHQATEDERISGEALEQIIEKRFGDKVCVATPNDPVSVDNAISRGYRVIRGNELSKEEWKNIREKSPILSSGKLFPHGIAKDVKVIEPDSNMIFLSDFAKFVMRKIYNIGIKIRFVTSKEMTVSACYGGRTLTFNVTKLGKGFFQSQITKDNLVLLIHELAHEFGMHTEMAYHEAITKLGAELIILALKSPEIFKQGRLE